MVKKKTAVALGFFDGIHIGHKKLIDVLLEKSNEYKLKSVVLTFKKHPLLFLKGIEPLYITSNYEKEKMLMNMGVEKIVFQKFDTDFASMSPIDFVKKIIINRLNAKVVIVGFNYRFGKDGIGDAELLKKICGENNIKAIIVSSCNIEGELISSSKIRELIKKGQVDKASKFLGRMYSLEGKIQQGKKIGSKIGFPTANIVPVKSKVLPMTGVYAVLATTEGVEQQAIANVGTRPTIGDNEVNIEVHIPGITKSLYNKNIMIKFIQRIREEKKFDSLEMLKQQIEEDLKNAMKVHREFNNG